MGGLRKGMKFTSSAIIAPDTDPSGIISQHTDRLDREKREREERIKNTIANMSEERKERQTTFKENRQNATKRIDELERLMPNLKQNLYTKLLNSAKNKGVETAIKENQKEIEEFKSLADELLDLKKSLGKEASYEYNNLLSSLAVDVDPNFLLYIDFTNYFKANVLAKCVKGVTPENKVILQTKLEDAGLFDFKGEPNSLIRASLKYFPDYIHLMNVDDACIALIIDPSKFKRLSAENKSIMFNNTAYMKRILTKNDELFLYLPYDYLDVLVDKDPGFVGRLIAKNPSVLSNFYPGFFADHYKEIKYMFSDLNKTKLKEVFKDWVWKFPELGEYFGIQTDNATLGV